MLLDSEGKFFEVVPEQGKSLNELADDLKIQRETTGKLEQRLKDAELSGDTEKQTEVLKELLPAREALFELEKEMKEMM